MACFLQSSSSSIRTASGEATVAGGEVRYNCLVQGYGRSIFLFTIVHACGWRRLAESLSPVLVHLVSKMMLDDL